MQNFFDRLAAVPLIAKIGVVCGVLVLIGGGYWYFFFDELNIERQQLEADGEKLRKEKAEYDKRKLEYLAFRKEVNDLLEEQKELLRVLPKRDDIEQFIESVQTRIEFAGLSKVSSVRESAVPVEMYVKIPIKMSLLGSYHQINRFFKNVGELKRIVNIEDLSLAPSTDTVGPTTGPTTLRANFVATTFQFSDKAAKPPGAAKTGTSVSSGGRK